MKCVREDESWVLEFLDQWTCQEDDGIRRVRRFEMSHDSNNIYLYHKEKIRPISYVTYK